MVLSVIAAIKAPWSSTSQLQQFVAARVWNQLGALAKAGDTNALTFGKTYGEDLGAGLVSSIS